MDGFNWRSGVAFICGIAPNLPGLAAACSPNLDVPNGVSYLYSLSWLISILVAGIVYWILHKISPMPISEYDHDEARSIEGMGVESGVETHASDEDKSESFDVEQKIR